MSIRSLLGRYSTGDVPQTFIDALNEISTYDADILGTRPEENPSVGLRGVFNSAVLASETPDLEAHRDRLALNQFLMKHGTPPKLKDIPIQGGPLPPSHC
jgi:hypothetical protein